MLQRLKLVTCFKNLTSNWQVKHFLLRREMWCCKIYIFCKFRNIYIFLLHEFCCFGDQWIYRLNIFFFCGKIPQIWQPLFMLLLLFFWRLTNFFRGPRHSQKLTNFYEYPVFLRFWTFFKTHSVVQSTKFIIIKNVLIAF